MKKNTVEIIELVKITNEIEFYVKNGAELNEDDRYEIVKSIITLGSLLPKNSIEISYEHPF